MPCMALTLKSRVTSKVHSVATEAYQCAYFEFMSYSHFVSFSVTILLCLYIFDVLETL